MSVCICMFILFSMSCNSIPTFLLAHSPHVDKINKTSFQLVSVIIHTKRDLKSLDSGQIVQPFS